MRRTLWHVKLHLPNHIHHCTNDYIYFCLLLLFYRISHFRTQSLLVAFARRVARYTNADRAQDVLLFALCYIHLLLIFIRFHTLLENEVEQKMEDKHQTCI